jgi:diguanylate cyclase (GGDEF)-like protein
MSPDELQRQVEQLRQDLQEERKIRAVLEQRLRELEVLAQTDPLTGLLNRRAIEAVARREVQRQQRYPSPLALGLLDVDHFREINARYLLPGGDEALRAVAQTLKGTLRAVDTVGRLGGDEFLVVAPATDGAGAAALAERLRAAVERSEVSYQGATIRLTCSLGFAVADTASMAEAMMHQAAQALSEAKTQGRNRCVVRVVTSDPR